VVRRHDLRGRAEHAVHLPAGQRRGERLGGRLHDVDARIGHPGDEAGQGQRLGVAEVTQPDAEADEGLGQPSRGAERRVDVGGHHGHSLGMPQHDLALLGELHPALHPLHERRATGRLQPRERLGQRGLRQAQTLGRLAETGLRGEGQEVAEVAQFHGWIVKC